MNLRNLIKEAVAIALAEETGAYRRLVITSTKAKQIKDGIEKYMKDSIHMYPDFTYKVIDSVNPNTIVVDLVGNKATVISIKLNDLATRLDKSAKVVVRKERKMTSVTKEGFSMNEGAMSNVNLIAQESKDFNSFVKAFMKEYPDTPGDEKDLKSWLQSVYDEAKSMEESAITKSAKFKKLIREEVRKVLKEDSINEAASVPSNIMDFAKRKGSYATSLVKKAAMWAEKAGKRISGGTAVGKNYSTIILDMKYQEGEISINLDNETIELFGEEVTDAKSFQKVLNSNSNTK